MKKYFLKQNAKIKYLNWVNLVDIELAETKREADLYNEAKSKIRVPKIPLYPFFGHSVKTVKIEKISENVNLNSMNLNSTSQSISCSEMINLKPNKKIYWLN
jgi:hypothetical protein